MIEIVRTAKISEGTFGVININGFPSNYVTLEDPDLNNAKGESCIPEGTYKAVPHNGPRFKDVWVLLGVPGREAILIHNGNTIDDTRGCILVGRKFGFLEGKPAILESAMALRELRAILPKSFTVNIRSSK